MGHPNNAVRGSRKTHTLFLLGVVLGSIRRHILLFWHKQRRLAVIILLVSLHTPGITTLKPTYPYHHLQVHLTKCYGILQMFAMKRSVFCR